MNRRPRMCAGCPFNPERTGPAIPDDVMADVVARITGGEEWVCHQTCDGAQVTARSSACAGVVYLPQTEEWWIRTADPDYWQMLTVCDETCHRPLHGFQRHRHPVRHSIEASEVEAMLRELDA